MARRPSNRWRSLLEGAVPAAGSARSDQLPDSQWEQSLYRGWRHRLQDPLRWLLAQRLHRHRALPAALRTGFERRWKEEKTTAVDLPIAYSNGGWTTKGHSLSFILNRDQPQSRTKSTKRFIFR